MDIAIKYYNLYLKTINMVFMAIITFHSRNKNFSNIVYTEI